MTHLGKHHPTVRRLRKLRRDAELRRAEGVLLAEGFHLAEEALAAGSRIELVVASPALPDSEAGAAILAAVSERGLALAEVDATVMESLQDARSAQPVLMLIRRTGYGWDALLAAGTQVPLIVVAHGVQDPGNLGGVLRTAHAAGASAAAVCASAADPFHPRSVRASMGSILRLPLVEAPADQLIEGFRRNGVAALAADPAGEVDFRDADLTVPLALFFGREGSGLPAELLARMDRTLRIPMAPGVDSLSVGAAAAVLLFEAARQRDGK